MSLSSLKEIKLDFSWVRNFFYTTNPPREEIETVLDLNNLLNNSWVLDMKYNDNGEFVKFCAEKHPDLNFVFFHEIKHTSSQEYSKFKSSFPQNVRVFYMTPTEFVKNMNPAYDEFIVTNKVGYRRIISSHIDNDNVLSKIDKSLYKDYGNTLQSMLLIVGNNPLRENNQFRVSFNYNYYTSKIFIYYPISDFNQN